MKPKSPLGPHPARFAKSSLGIPDAQARALVRRAELDLQQKSYQKSYPAPHLWRRRPPS